MISIDLIFQTFCELVKLGLFLVFVALPVAIGLSRLICGR